jgi:hypothetical protein
MTFPPEPGARLVQVNIDFLNREFQQVLDHYRGYYGVWLSIIGGMIGSAGPFVAQSLGMK